MFVFCLQLLSSYITVYFFCLDGVCPFLDKRITYLFTYLFGVGIRPDGLNGETIWDFIATSHSGADFI